MSAAAIAIAAVGVMFIIATAMAMITSNARSDARVRWMLEAAARERRDLEAAARKERERLLEVIIAPHLAMGHLVPDSDGGAMSDDDADKAYASSPAAEVPWDDDLAVVAMPASEEQ